MAFTHSLSTNNYGPARIIVAPSAANGTHTTIASAISDAVSGDTIFIRDGTYTEDLMLKAGINITAFANGVYGRNATGIPTVEIIGEITAAFAGTCSICNVRLITNGAPFLTVSGSSATIALLNTCELICADNTGIVNSSSSSGSNVYAIDCYGNILTTGIAIFSMSSAGRMFFRECHFNNSGSSSTPNLMSGGITTMRYCHFNSAFETSGTTAIVQMQYTVLNTTAIDVPCLTHNSTSSNNSLQFTTFTSDNAIALVTGAGTSIDLLAPVFITAGGFAHTSIGGTATILGTENTATSFATASGSATPTAAGVLTIAGAGGITASASGSTVTLTGGSSQTQAAFSAYNTSLRSNVTGNGTEYTVVFDTELFDVGSNFASNTFTAPVTGKYLFCASVACTDITSNNPNCNINIVSTSSSMRGSLMRTIDVYSPTVGISLFISHVLSMTAGDTAYVSIIFGGTVSNVDVFGDATATPARTCFSGSLLLEG